MKRVFYYRFGSFLFLVFVSLVGVARNKKPVKNGFFNCQFSSSPVTDSIPAQVKEVPKSRRQQVPVQVPVKIEVKPIQVIKLKIIKPVIKAIH